MVNKLLRTFVAGALAAALLTSGAAPSQGQAEGEEPEPTELAPAGKSGDRHRDRCERDGRVSFICGPENPEDLAEVPGTPWVLISSWQADGYLSAANARTGKAVEVYPGNRPRARHDTERYGDCPGPMPEDFWAHGISLQPGERGVHTLYVVRHEGREAIEVFEVDARRHTPRLTWIGCVLPPEGGPEAPAHDFNSVIWLPEGGLAVTRPAVDEVWEWKPDSGWAAVPSTAGISPNGIEVSPDGRYYFIGGHGTETFYRVDREAPYERDDLWVGFHIDNVHFDDSGRLLVAGHDATIQAVIDCLVYEDGTHTTDNSRCDNIISRVLRIDQDLEDEEEIFRYRTNDRLALGTAAIEVKDRIWIGGLRGERVAIIRSPR